MKGNPFFYADEDDIRKGLVADVYFLRGKKIMESLGLNPLVYGEVTASGIPENGSFGIFCGLEEVLRLLEGLPVTVKAMPEGSLFYPGEPVLSIEGAYNDFGIFETAFLGFLCFSSGIATKSARMKLNCLDKPVYSFGARRTHPSIAPAVERAAYIGGCDGVATIAAAEILGLKPVGTMAHAYIIAIGDPKEAYINYDRFIDEDIPRVALIDTFEDEKFGALTAAEALGERLYAVRLDTPGSRRGNFRKIIEEVRWELNLRGYSNVKIFISGGIDENTVKELYEIVDAFGIGTAISNARVIDFSFDIVEKEGKPIAKRGKKSGRKQVYECKDCLKHRVLPEESEIPTCPECLSKMEPLLLTYIDGGLRIVKEEKPQFSRDRTIKYLRKIKEVSLD
ncbi:MAG: nicotinate phosphoribosyltransferase [Actinobacteria bacterium]|nr:nicotinate phosphoribosyltransferase [Actinomycetota bacterium]